MKTFEDYLADQHAKQYNGLDDDMSDALEDWLINLDNQEIIDFAETWGKILIIK